MDCKRRMPPKRKSIENLALVKQFLPQLDALWMVDCKHPKGGSSGFGQADKYRAMPLKMPFPGLAPWVKKQSNLTRVGIDSREIWAFVKVTSSAAEA